MIWLTMLEEFEKLLKSVDLSAYREKYRPVKLVEMDMPKDAQAIESLYEVYWVQKKFVDFAEFYELYLKAHHTDIERFRQKITMCEDCFYRGLPARIYRTWASIITQIHAGYVAAAVFGPDSVKMSAELDHKGADFQVTYKGEILNYQVKKTSFSREVRRAKKTNNQLPGKSIDINYEVPNFEHIKNPYRKDGKIYADAKGFMEVMKAGYEKCFDNGFVVFTPKIFEEEKARIDKN